MPLKQGTRRKNSGLELSPKTRPAWTGSRNWPIATITTAFSASVAPQTSRRSRRYYDLSRAWHPDRFFRKDTGDYAIIIENVFVAITEPTASWGAKRSASCDHDFQARARPNHRPLRSRGRRTNLGTDPFAEPAAGHRPALDRVHGRAQEQGDGRGRG